jgi:hypothetical protein
MANPVTHPIADCEAEIAEFLKEGPLLHRYRMAHAEANA